MNAGTTHICVDLDGTLVKTDTLLESILVFIKSNPLNILRCFYWLRLGRSGFKEKLAESVELDASILPYNESLLEYLRVESKTKQIHLCTAANRKIAQAVANFIGVFSSVYASTSQKNLKGRNKADTLAQEFGEKNVIYAGNDSADLPVWQHAAGAIVVSNSKNFLSRVKKHTTVLQVFPATNKGITRYIRALRLHQWVKNTLIFLPLILAHKFTSISGYVDVLAGFIAFGMIASSNYIINDLLDLGSDRRHPTKRMRPFASGEVSIIAGLVQAALLFLAGLLLALKVGTGFLFYMLIYLVATIVYSYAVKSIVILDIIILASLYTLRLVAGAAAIHEPVTFWLLAYSLFIFFSLASVKRYAELLRLDVNEKASGRGYVQEDLGFVRNMGISSGLISVLVFALYLNDPGIISKYQTPEWLWMITPLLLYWIARIWHLTYHGKMHDDPVVFALKDKPSYILAGLIVISIFMAV